MKKIIVLLIALLIAVPAVEAQNKALEKARKKEYKEKMKEYKKEGWKIFGTSRSLDVALLTHYEKLNEMGEDAFEVVGVAAKFESKNLGKQMAINSACQTYAQSAGSYVKGRVVSDFTGDGIDTNAEFEHFYAAYERLVEKEIKGEMVESYSIIRKVGVNHKTGNEQFEMQVYYIVNENAASKARIKAFESAAKESAAAQKYAGKVSDFVKEGFKVE